MIVPRLPAAGAGCFTCAFFSPSHREKIGQCRRRAPYTAFHKTPEGSKPKTEWPLVRDHDWCGEHAEVVEQPDGTA